MTLPPSQAITEALLTALTADAELSTLLPDGIWLGYARPLSPTSPRTRFGILDLVPMVSRDIAVFGGRAIEERQYLVKAVVQDDSPVTASQAAQRMNELLEDVAIPASGYTWISIRRLWPLEIVEPDEGDPQKTWQHRGGYYQVEYAVA